MRAIRRACRQIIATLDIPTPFDVHRLCAGVAARRGRPIVLHGIAMPAGSPSGVWLSTPNGDYIFYEDHTTPLHQEHIILHELGHLLSAGQDAAPGSDAVADPSTFRVLAADQATRLLLPDLDPDVVERLLHRTGYSEVEELTAELIATMILERANRWRPVSEWEASPQGADLRQRVHLTLEPSEGRR